MIRLLPGRDRRVKAGHPWAFSNEIAMNPAAKALPPGSVVRLEGDDGVKHGVWHFNPHSLIAARKLDRDKLFDRPHYRLIHAEADGLPGLVIDRYGDAVTIQANSAGMEAATPLILEALHALIQPRMVIARNDSAVRALESLAEETKLLHGEAGMITVEASGLSFAVNPVGGKRPRHWKPWNAWWVLASTSAW